MCAVPRLLTVQWVNLINYLSLFLDAEVKTVQVPPFAESITEGDIRWIKEVGDSVGEDEPVAEVETDKVSR